MNLNCSADEIEVTDCNSCRFKIRQGYTDEMHAGDAEARPYKILSSFAETRT